MKLPLLALAIGLMAGTAIGADSPAPPRGDQQRQAAYPEIHEDRTVTFRVRAPGATNVSVAGEWRGGGTPMTNDQGNWSATIGPLAPDLYSYSIVVDGLHVIDPSNSQLKPMRFPNSSVLDIHGETPCLHDFQSVPHGTVRLHEYNSKALGRIRSLRVYTPPGYDKNTHTKYPVLYLFHGSGDNEATWTEFGHAHLITDNLLAQGKIKPMIIVMPGGHAYTGQSAGTNTEARMKNINLFEQDLLGDVLPMIEENYRVKSGAENRAIIGLSMGGSQSLSIGLKHPELFAWVGGMSSGIRNPMEQFEGLFKDPKDTNKKLKLLWFACGRSDQLLESNQQFDKLLTEHGIKHQFQEVEGAHQWRVWRNNLAEFEPMIFRR
ncbi:esterase [Pedosphaera parvula]|uniref:Putative esterase n=1 Tax=Pedosphaera parvula (strain Ellin514) TaxID=320771 RepID=B9XCE5_PEDPL|nr:esterase [Pedosphaera parvula]EEF62613.1 putative esterase [Pedosphaera parvula Ellin514]